MLSPCFYLFDTPIEKPEPINDKMFGQNLHT